MAKIFDLSTMHGRLASARDAAGFKSPRAAARARGWNENTYKAHEQRNKFGEDEARRYGRAFGYNWLWLLHKTGEPKGRGQADVDETDSRPPRQSRSMVTIREIDVTAGAGGGGEAMVGYRRKTDGSYQPSDLVKAEALFPIAWLNAMGLDPAFTDVVRVSGDSMWPEIDDGDWAFVDRRVYQLKADDIYLIWDGFGVVVKSLQLIRGSKPARVRIISANLKYKIDEVPLSEIRIIGRVRFRIGRVLRRD